MRMVRVFTLCAVVCLSLSAMAQTKTKSAATRFEVNTSLPKPACARTVIRREMKRVSTFRKNGCTVRQ